MASFCLVNVACFHASFVGSPSFRPTFKYYNKWISLITGLACVIIMFFLDWISALITVFVMGLIYLYISKKRPGMCGPQPVGRALNHGLRCQLGIVDARSRLQQRPVFGAKTEPHQGSREELPALDPAADRQSQCPNPVGRVCKPNHEKSKPPADWTHHQL